MARFGFEPFGRNCPEEAAKERRGRKEFRGQRPESGVQQRKLTLLTWIAATISAPGVLQEQTEATERSGFIPGEASPQTLDELPRLTHEERRLLCRRALAIDEVGDVAELEHTAVEGFALLDRMEAEDTARGPSR